MQILALVQQPGHLPAEALGSPPGVEDVAALVVTDDEVYCLAPDRSVVSGWSARTEEWTEPAGPVAEIAATG
ncbi:hypothetical protein AB0H12_33405 [Actinosynnema sp. NPDC023794]